MYFSLSTHYTSGRVDGLQSCFLQGASLPPTHLPYGNSTRACLLALFLPSMSKVTARPVPFSLFPPVMSSHCGLGLWSGLLIASTVKGPPGIY